MKGMNAITGRAISGLAHLYQSIGQILSTALASRLKRRTFGSDIPDLIDAPTSGATITLLYAATATALMRWEPRLTLTRIQFSMDTSEQGRPIAYLDIEGYTTETGEPVSTRINLSTGAVS